MLYGIPTGYSVRNVCGANEGSAIDPKNLTLPADLQYVRFDCERETLVFLTRPQPFAVLELPLAPVQFYTTKIEYEYHFI